MSDELEAAWKAHADSAEHKEARHNLARNAHLHAEATLKQAFEAGWNARAPTEGEK